MTRRSTSAPRLYVDSLNTMIDSQTTRASALTNRVPTAVLALEVAGAAIALALLAFYLGLSKRGIVGVLIASLLVTLMLLVTFDLDRPTRGLIKVPSTPLTNLRASMELPPAAAALQQALPEHAKRACAGRARPVGPGRQRVVGEA